MGLIEQARKDVQQITSNLNEFGVAITLVSPSNITVLVTGLHSKHRISVDTDGSPINTKNAYVSISEKVLTDLSYPVRNSSGEVDLKNHKATVKDSTGNNCDYVIREWFPDETLGLLVLILGDYE